jgi:hypothetical protein
MIRELGRVQPDGEEVRIAVIFAAVTRVDRRRKNESSSPDEKS